MMNLLCKMIGHKALKVAYSVTYCERCGKADDYYGTGDQWLEEEWDGYFGKLKSIWWKATEPVRKYVTRRCEQCKKRIWRKRYTEDFCSKDCHDQWLPF